MYFSGSLNMLFSVNEIGTFFSKWNNVDVIRTENFVISLFIHGCPAVKSQYCAVRGKLSDRDGSGVLCLSSHSIMHLLYYISSIIIMLFQNKHNRKL
jgi:hypothetical protein